MLNISGIKAGPTLLDKIFFRVSNPWYPTIMVLPIMALLLWAAQSYLHYSWYKVTGLFVVGTLSWTLAEYILHRFIFHLTSIKEPWKSFASGIHLAHHRDTEDKYMLFPPLTASLLIGSVLYLIFVLIVQSWSVGAILIAGLLAGYAIYEWAHYGAHQFQSQNSYVKYMRRYHLAHHFKAPKKYFGVTNPVWDMVFGTHGPLKFEVKR